jgi:hypothetical protein
MREVLKLDDESTTVDPQKLIRLSPVFQAGVMRHDSKTWPEEEENDEIALLKAFLWFSAIGSCVIGVILFALMNRSSL